MHTAERDAVVEQHRVLIYALTWKWMKRLRMPASDFEDMAQEAMIAALGACETWEPQKGSYSTHVGWRVRRAIGRVLETALTKKRGAGVRPLILDEHGLCEATGEFASARPEAFTEEDDEQVVIAQRVNAALECLTAQQRQVIQLVYFAGLRQVDAARQMGCSKQLVQLVVKAAFKKLRHALGGKP
jgi:RNA polymerase sigma factor (sigma-70 family)